MLGAAAAGALIIGIPLAGVLCLERQSMEEVQKRLDYYEKLQEQYSYVSLFVLTEDVVAGEELTASMLAERRAQSAEDLSLAQSLTMDDLLGKRLKLSLTKGAALSRDVVYEGEPVSEDERRVELTELFWPKTLRENEFVDVRIVFPNGEDYLVVKHKRVYRLIRDEEDEVLAVELRFLEEELLRYQAALVDTKAYEDTRLYALQYSGDYQAAATEYYPVNQAVFGLLQWNPNIPDLFLVDGEQERRKVLESHLERFLTKEPLTKEDFAAETDSDAGDSPTDDVSAEDASMTKEPLTLYTGLPEEP